MTISRGMLIYEGDPGVELTKLKDVYENQVTLSKISMGLHAGTHVDAPSHYVMGGHSIENTDLNLLCGKARVCDLSSVDALSINVSDLKDAGIVKDQIVLFKTRNSELLEKPFFSREFVYLENDVADYLVEKGVRSVGMDYLSLESFNSKDHYVHKTLLSNNIPVIEGLDLRHVEAGSYMMYCLPLKIKRGEAAPARCILVR